MLRDVFQFHNGGSAPSIEEIRETTVVTLSLNPCGSLAISPSVISAAEIHYLSLIDDWLTDLSWVHEFAHTGFTYITRIKKSIASADKDDLKTRLRKERFAEIVFMKQFRRRCLRQSKIIVAGNA
jgi:hypothetical protein